MVRARMKQLLSGLDDLVHLSWPICRPPLVLYIVCMHAYNNYDQSTIRVLCMYGSRGQSITSTVEVCFCMPWTCPGAYSSSSPVPPPLDPQHDGPGYTDVPNFLFTPFPFLRVTPFSPPLPIPSIMFCDAGRALVPFSYFNTGVVFINGHY